jgi:hypothetical protein
MKGMMKMTAKQYLKQAYHLNELINTDIEEAAQLRALSTSLVYFMAAFLLE